jgi:hypothetical protein
MALRRGSDFQLGGTLGGSGKKFCGCNHTSTSGWKWTGQLSCAMKMTSASG